MSGNENNCIALQDPSNAVDDYLDRLLDDSVSESCHAILPEQSGGDVVSAPGGRDTDDMLPSVTSDNLLPDMQCKEESSQSASPSGPEGDAEASSILVSDVPEASAQTEVAVHSNVGVTPDPETADEVPSARLFACFKFQAMGINFAVPAEHYIGDFPFPEDIASENEGPEGLLGEMLVGGKRIRVADIVVVAIPESRRGALRPRAGNRRVLQIGRGNWGIVCEGEIERIELSSDNIHWRTEQGKRQWLAGTIVDQKCALLDIEVVERILDRGEWEE